MSEKAQKQLVALSARLRICPQSRFDRLGAGANSRVQPDGAKPWEWDKAPKNKYFDDLIARRQHDRPTFGDVGTCRHFWRYVPPQLATPQKWGLLKIHKSKQPGLTRWGFLLAVAGSSAFGKFAYRPQKRKAPLLT